jgi:Domain of unknown function (DUF4253)
MTLDEVAANVGERLGLPMRPFATVDFGREQIDSARTVIVRGAEVEKTLRFVREGLPAGYIAFLGTGAVAANPERRKAELVIAPGADQFDILRVAQSDACNYDLNTEDLIAKLKALSLTIGIDIVSAVTDTIEFDRLSDPVDFTAFCADLYEFCPDIVDQGTETLEALEAEIRSSRRVFLWWD